MKLSFKKLYPKLRIPSIVALSFALTWILVYDITQISYFSPTNKSSDFEPGDFYQLVEQSRPVRAYCPEVVLVPIDGLSRFEIASVIEEIAECSPGIIGIDLLWGYPQSETDGYLREVLDNATCQIVVPDTAAYIYSDVAGLIEGDVTLNDGEHGECVRNVFGSNSMSAVIARSILQHDFRNDIETDIPMRFGHYEFITVIPDSIKAFGNLISGNAVLVGTLDDRADMHPTPVATAMPGMLIHATGIASLIDSDCPRKSPVWLDWVLAVVICTVFIWVNLLSKSWRGGDLAMRLFQILFLILILFSGTMIYLYTGLSIDFSRPLLMVAAAAVAADLWLGAEQLFTRKKMKRIIIVLIGIFFIVSSADAGLLLLRVRGEVIVKGLKESHPAAVREKVKNSTVLMLPRGASVAILDESTKSVYYSPESGGTLTVGNIIKTARREADNNMSAIVRQAMSSLEGGHSAEGRKGVSYRGDGSDGKLEQAIADIILSHTVVGCSSINAKIIENRDSTCYMSVDNKLDKILYMNIVMSLPGCKPQLLFSMSNTAYIPCIVAVPGRTDLTSLRFFGLQPEYLYIVSSSEPFDTGLVNLLLRRNKPSEEARSLQGTIVFSPLNQ